MPSSCPSNSSNLSGNLNINSITSSGARLLMTLPLLTGFSGGRRSSYVGDDGITAGDAIRYDAASGSVSEGKYIKAKADTPANSEVVGIIENISEGSGGSVTIVLCGQVEYPSTKLVTATHIDPDAGVTGSAGGNDVYFLSAATAGVLQNLAPTSPTQVIKPIYQVAPDLDPGSPWTGQVVNYIGYQAGGQVVAQDFRQLPVGAVAQVPNFRNTSETETVGWVAFGTELNLNPGTNNTIDTYGYAYSNGLGEISETNIRIYTTTSPSSNMVKQNFTIKKDGKVRIKGKITQVNAASKWFDAKISSVYYNDISLYVKKGNLIELISGGFLTISESEFKYLSYNLPQVSSSTPANKIILIIDGVNRTYQSTYYIFASADSAPGNWNSMQGLAVAIPNEIESLDKMTVNELQITDTTTSTTYNIDNLAIAISNIADEVSTLTNQMNGEGGKITFNRVTKS